MKHPRLKGKKKKKEIKKERKEKIKEEKTGSILNILM